MDQIDHKIFIKHYLERRSLPNLLEFSGKLILSSNDHGDMIFVLDNLNACPRNPLFNVIATLGGDELVVSSMKDGHVALKLVSYDV